MLGLLRGKVYLLKEYEIYKTYICSLIHNRIGSDFKAFEITVMVDKASRKMSQRTYLPATGGVINHEPDPPEEMAWVYRLRASWSKPRGARSLCATTPQGVIGEDCVAYRN
jgi:hypothetical protein